MGEDPLVVRMIWRVEEQTVTYGLGPRGRFGTQLQLQRPVRSQGGGTNRCGATLRHRRVDARRDQRHKADGNDGNLGTGAH